MVGPNIFKFKLTCSFIKDVFEIDLEVIKQDLMSATRNLDGKIFFGSLCFKLQIDWNFVKTLKKFIKI